MSTSTEVKKSLNNEKKLSKKPFYKEESTTYCKFKINHLVLCNTCPNELDDVQRLIIPTKDYFYSEIGFYMLTTINSIDKLFDTIPYGLNDIEKNWSST